MADPRHLSVIVVPEGARESLTWRISYGRLRLLAAAGVLAVLVLTAMAGSWWYLAARAVRVAELEGEVAALEADRARIEGLARELEGLEQQYGRIRALFGGETSQVTSDLWLPPPAPARSGGAPGRAPAEDGRPTSWPLTERGFITQTVMGAPDAEHPGLDIAVPADSYVRAAGPGIVVDVGEDRVYGRFVLLDHGSGYRSLYAHTSATFVDKGRRVRRNEVIALSGSTGRSTAPHLHFEILREGQPVDPLTMVTQP